MIRINTTINSAELQIIKYSTLIDSLSNSLNGLITDTISSTFIDTTRFAVNASEHNLKQTATSRSTVIQDSTKHKITSDSIIMGTEPPPTENKMPKINRSFQFTSQTAYLLSEVKIVSQIKCTFALSGIWPERKVTTALLVGEKNKIDNWNERTIHFVLIGVNDRNNEIECIFKEKSTNYDSEDAGIIRKPRIARLLVKLVENHYEGNISWSEVSGSGVKPKQISIPVILTSAM